MIFSARSTTSSRSSVQAPVERYFQPPSHTTNTMVPDVDLLGHPDRAGQRGAGRDAGEDAALVDQPAGPLDRLAGPHDALAVEQLAPPHFS